MAYRTNTIIPDLAWTFFCYSQNKGRRGVNTIFSNKVRVDITEIIVIRGYGPPWWVIGQKKSCNS